MSKKLLLFTLLLMLIIVPLAGCAQTPTEEPATEAPAEEPAAEEPTEEAATEEPAAEEPTEEAAAEEPTEEPAAETPESLHIVYLTPSTESGYWGEYVRIGVENGIMDIEDQYGVSVEYEYQGPALEASQDEYMSILEGVIAKQPDAILMGQLYPDAVAPYIVDATDMGIYVNLISLGVDLPGEDYGTLYFCDQPQQGELAAQAFYDAMVAKDLPMDGVVGMHMSVVVPVLEEKLNRFRDTLQELAPELTILDTQYNENDVNNGISLMEAQLATYGDQLVGFFGGNNVTGDAIVRVIEESGRADTLVGVAVDSDPAEIEGMRNGYLDALIVQTPYDQAYNAAMGAAAYLIDGTESPDEVNMPASVVTPANMDEPDMAALLDPTLLKR
jgi:ribose transport system substrate-binding protein